MGPGAWDGDEGLHSGGDEVSIGLVAYLPVNVLHDNITETAIREGEVTLRGTHSRVGLVVEELRDKVLSLNLAHGDSSTVFHPHIGDVVIRHLDESKPHTTGIDVGVGRLEGTQGETLIDDLLKARQAFGLVFSVNDELYLGRGSSH